MAVFKDISDLPAGAALGAADLVEIEQGGVSKKATATDIRAFVATPSILDTGGTLALPATPDPSQRIVVYNKGLEAFITQSDAEHGINFQNSLFTTKGATGRIRMGQKDVAELLYVGSGSSRVEPGAKLADPATLPTGTGQGASFSPDGVYLAIAHTTTPFVTIYKRSGDTFTKLSDPASLPAAAGQRATFSPDSAYLAVAHTTTPFVTIYKRSGDTFTKLSDPASLPASTGNGGAFSPDGAYLAIAHTTTPFVTIYKNIEAVVKAWEVMRYSTLNPVLLPSRFE